MYQVELYQVSVAVEVSPVYVHVYVLLTREREYSGPTAVVWHHATWASAKAAHASVSA